MEDALFVLVVVEHLDVDSEGVIKVIVVSWPSIEESSEDSDDLDEDVGLRRVDACAESLDNSIALDRDLSLGSIHRCR